MKVYAAVAVILSVQLGLLPAYIAKTTDLGGELCDPVFYYASGRTCILLWDRTLLGHVDKRDSHRAWSVIQAGICDGDQLGTRPDVGRGVGVL